MLDGQVIATTVGDGRLLRATDGIVAIPFGPRAADVK